MSFRFTIIVALLSCLTTIVFSQPVTITPPSATIQPGGSVTLTASGATYYQWSPATGLSTTEGPVTVASPTVTTTYTCEGYAPGAESVVNGGFEQGNVGFTSSYEYNSNLWNEGTYYVDSDASLHHENFHGYGHGGSGNFMMVNGSISPGTNVWTEQITVLPNKWYAFSTWACTLAGVAGQMALLQFSINGTQIGDIFSAPASTMIWEQFYELWYSGNSTTATITILNQNTNGDGNDFGLDDISFRELVLVGSPTCTVYVGNMSATATADDTELCEGESTTLHALPTGGSGNYSYSWTPDNSLNNANIQHPVATPPVGTTTYTCHITDNSWGSSQNVSVSIVVHPNEEAHEYETICEGDTYDFYGQMVSAPAMYEHHTQTQYGCDKTIYLHLDNWPIYDETTINAYICDGESYLFYGTSYSQTCQEAYTDQSIHGCDSIVRLNLEVYPPNDTVPVDVSICIGQTYNFHGSEYDLDGQVAYFDTIDNHGCLKVEKLLLSVDEYQTPPVQHQYECVAHGATPEWTWDKTGITYHEDTYDEIILDDPNGGCPFKYRLDLRFHEEFYHEESKMACIGYYWPITDSTYYESQDRIEKTFHHSFGDKFCDSTYVLHLEIGDIEMNEFVLDTCDGYFWDPQNHVYETEDDFDPEDHYYTIPDTYQRVYKNLQGCDSVVKITMIFEYTPHPYEIQSIGGTTAPWVIPASEFQINSYEFVLKESQNAEWDSVGWQFCKRDLSTGQLMPSDINWRMIVKGALHDTCKVYALSYTPDTIWLRATAYNPCTRGGVHRDYWMVCSYYDIDEQGGMAGFEVVPNPNSGQMTLQFEHFTGKVGIKVYDMTGNLMDDLQTTIDMESSSMPYDFNDRADGIYLFVVTSNEGTAFKKVIVTR